MTEILTHRVTGDGEPLLLLNGGLMTAGSWDPMLPLLDGYRVIRCDFRGQLQSPGAHASLEEHAHDLDRLLESLGLESAHLFGASFGGEVGLLVAALHPKRVSSLVVLTATDRLTHTMRESGRELLALAEAAARGGDGGAVFRAVARNTFSPGWLATQPSDLIERRAEQVAQLPRSWFEGLVSLMAALDKLDLDDALPRIEAPTLILGAELDEVFPIEHSRALATRIPGAELSVIANAGHGAILEATAEVFAEMRRFHAAIGGRPPMSDLPDSVRFVHDARRP